MGDTGMGGGGAVGPNYSIGSVRRAEDLCCGEVRLPYYRGR